MFIESITLVRHPDNIGFLMSPGSHRLSSIAYNVEVEMACTHMNDNIFMLLVFLSSFIET